MGVPYNNLYIGCDYSQYTYISWEDFRHAFGTSKTNVYYYGNMHLTIL